MPEYTVSWTIDSIDADTPEEAARICREMQLDPTSTATVFYVEDEGGATVEVDTLTGDPNAIA